MKLMAHAVYHLYLYLLLVCLLYMSNIFASRSIGHVYVVQTSPLISNCLLHGIADRFTRRYLQEHETDANRWALYFCIRHRRRHTVLCDKKFGHIYDGSAIRPTARNLSYTDCYRISIRRFTRRILHTSRAQVDASRGDWYVFKHRETPPQPIDDKSPAPARGFAPFYVHRWVVHPTGWVARQAYNTKSPHPTVAFSSAVVEMLTARLSKHLLHLDVQSRRTRARCQRRCHINVVLSHLMDHSQCIAEWCCSNMSPYEWSAERQA